jgi:hypothetical protein
MFPLWDSKCVGNFMSASWQEIDFFFGIWKLAWLPSGTNAPPNWDLTELPQIALRHMHIYFHENSFLFERQHLPLRFRNTHIVFGCWVQSFVVTMVAIWMTVACCVLKLRAVCTPVVGNVMPPLQLRGEFYNTLKFENVWRWRLWYITPRFWTLSVVWIIILWNYSVSKPGSWFRLQVKRGVEIWR